MKTQIEIPVLEKSKVKNSKSATATPASSCCAPKQESSGCCTPSENPQDNDGACCAQPTDGSACCDKA